MDYVTFSRQKKLEKPRKSGEKIRGYTSLDFFSDALRILRTAS